MPNAHESQKDSDWVRNGCGSPGRRAVSLSQ